MMDRIGGILITLKAGLDSLANPASDPVAAVFTLALVVAVLLLFVLLIFLAVSLVSSEESMSPDEGEEDSRAPHSSRRRATLQLLGAVTVILLIAYGWAYSVSDSMCARCHFTKRAVDSHAAGSHAGVKCADCHVERGFAGSVLARAKGARNAVVALTGAESRKPVPAEVVDDSCLSCHPSVISGTTLARSVRMRHSDVMEIGYRCVDCHNTEGHQASVSRPRYPNMSMCILCHDGSRAAATCSTCHSEDVGVAARKPRRTFAQVVVSRDDCRGCHSLQACNTCHGLELPHSAEFRSGFHARKAFLQPTVCRKCHDTRAFCNGCHKFKTDRTGANRIREHDRLGAFGAWHSQDITYGVNSCGCHDDDRQRFCNYCHGPQPER